MGATKKRKKKRRNYSEPPPALREEMNLVLGKVGHRSCEFTEEKGDFICELMKRGESQRSICRRDGMPEELTINAWLDRFPRFKRRYEEAHAIRLAGHADQVIDLADAEPTMNERGVDMGAVQLQKLRVDSRKWILSKLLPRKYGDVQSIELTGRDGGAVQIEGSSGRGAELLAAWSAGRAVKALPVIEHPSVNADESSDAKE